LASTSTPELELARRRRALLWLTGTLFCLWTVWSTIVLPRLPGAQGGEHVFQAVSIRLLLWVLPAGIYLWSQDGQRLFERLWLGPPPTLRNGFNAVGISALASLAVSLDVARKLDRTPGEVWRELVATLAWELPVAPFFEELIFRGVILAQLLLVLGAMQGDHPASTAERLRVWLANLTASMIFTGLHWPWWIYSGGWGPEFWTQSAGVFLISLVLGMVFVGGRSIWPCVVLHWLNNELSRLVP
jgi:membrane protease YdiL (CAAX protease family)